MIWDFKSTVICDGGKIPLDKKYLINSENEMFFEIQYKGNTISNIKSKFVGFLIYHNEIIISFPKHYAIAESESLTKEDINLLTSILKIEQGKKIGFGNELSHNKLFPYDAYKNVCLYYKKFGLYFEHTTLKEPGFKGKINWKETLKYSNKIISNKNLLFLPFFNEKHIVQDDLVTECMKFVMFDGYKKFGRYFNEGVKSTNYIESNIFRYKETLITELLKLKSKTFKDTTIQLIDSLITYILWSSNKYNDVIFATQHFETFWENVIHHYLNTHFNYNEVNDQIFFKKHENISLFHKVTHAIQAEKKEDRNFKVSYDHLFIDEKKKKAFLFDSKYYDEISSFDYKQFSYYFTLLDYLYREFTENEERVNPFHYRIYNSLIIPSTENHNKIHLDTRSSMNKQHPFLRNLIIKEYYLSIKEVLNWYIRN